MASGRSGSSEERSANLTASTAHRPVFTFMPHPLPMPLMPMLPMGAQHKESSLGRNGGASRVGPYPSSANAVDSSPVFKATNPSHVSYCAFCKVRGRAVRGNSYFLGSCQSEHTRPPALRRPRRLRAAGGKGGLMLRAGSGTSTCATSAGCGTSTAGCPRHPQPRHRPPPRARIRPAADQWRPQPQFRLQHPPS